MKIRFCLCFFMLGILSMPVFAQCERVYTIGAYQEAIAAQVAITKIGPLDSSEIPENLPSSFLEKDGSYAGGEAFCSIKKACQALKKLLAKGVLSNDTPWEIYVLDAKWGHDTYRLRANDYRISHPVKVLGPADEQCHAHSDPI